jgi:Alw26I/Eco31I/Esp3I family type II restriction m6 adenine DNA methyltransferase
MLSYYRNENIFSEIYLEEITAQPEHEAVLASLKVLWEYRTYAETSSLNAWVLTYIHEVLFALGFHARTKNEAISFLYPMGSADQPVSLCYMTPPEENLDNTKMGRNWAEKTIRSLRDQGLQWGLLTNGKLWRIYHLDETTPYETYLEIDLENILTNQAKEAYQIFHKFMKAENFAMDEDGICQFDRYKKESKDKIDYIEKELANALKQREEGGQGVLSDICMGYVETLRKQGDIDLDDEDLRRKIYHCAMLYMFRLLFLFYADARGLLSEENNTLLREVSKRARELHKSEQIETDQYSLWNMLEMIFVDIDQTYNGGLFSPQESDFTLFIEEARIANRYLVPVLHHLTTYKEKDGREQAISYRDMGVRHLGTLYEGLLEHKLFIADEDTEVKVTKGKIMFIPASKGGKLVVGQFLPAGTVYFAGDPSERKATGSYYTPEYIVDYIVRNTVGEKLNELKKAFLDDEINNLKAYQQALDDSERQAIAALLGENALQFIRERVLELSVLDPAMGSGHFLVNATNLISNAITELLNAVGVEGEVPTGAAYWRRWVVESCIYGVDINPLAVELAKLSLWILSMAKNQPLSFMNHHLKCGNSLVGAKLEEIGYYPFSIDKKEPQQLSFFERDPDFKAAVIDAIEKSHLITRHSSTSVEDVQEKKAWLEEIEQTLKGYKAICDIHTELYFEKVVDEKQYIELVEDKDFVKAFTLDTSDSFFHWELEYPEILVNISENKKFEQGKFSVVIGNPPYDNISKKELGNIASKLLYYFGSIEKYKFALGRKLDLYRLFICLADYLVSDIGLIGLIIPMSLLADQQTSSLRSHIIRDNTLLRVDVFPQKDDPKRRVFQAAKLATCIPIIRKGISINQNTILHIHPGNKFEELKGELVLNSSMMSQIIHKIGSIPQVDSMLEMDLLLQLQESSKFQTMGDILVTYQGELNETTHRHLLTIDSDSGAKVYRGGNVQRYNFIEVAKQGKDYYINKDKFEKYQGRGKFNHIQCKRFGYQRKAALDNWRRLIFCELPQPSYCFESISYFLYEDRSYFALALLNSKLLEWRFQATSSNNMVSTNEIANLPIPKVTFTTASEIKTRELAEAQRLFRLEKGSEVLELSKKNLVERMDVVHDILAFLAIQMIEMNKQCQFEVKRFVSWIQGEIGVSLDGLTGKTFIQNFLGDYQKNQRNVTLDEILAVLNKNKNKIHVNISDSIFLERINKEYQVSMDKLLPIKKQLAATDHLINQIVYQLYNLTEEEIAIVDSKVN